MKILAIIVSLISLLPANAKDNIRFIENKGQVADLEYNLVREVKFSSNGKSGNFYLRRAGFSWVEGNYEQVQDKD